MQMARLYDSGKMFGQYSLSSLTFEYRQQIEKVITSLPQKLKGDYMKERPGTKNNPERERELD